MQEVQGNVQVGGGGRKQYKERCGMSEEVAVKSQMDAFRAAMQQGIEGLTRAGEIWVAVLDEDPRNADKFKATFADLVPLSAWAQFEAIGRKWMHPRLIMGGVADRRKSALIKKLTYSAQERVFSRECFKLLTAAGDTLEVDLLEATTEQAEQICNGASTRSLLEQRAWVESRVESRVVARAQEQAELLPYTINDGKVSFRRGTTLTRAEMKRLLAEM